MAKRPTTAHTRTRKPRAKAAASGRKARKPRRRTPATAPPGGSSPTPPQPARATRALERPRRDGTHHVPADFHALYDRGFRSARGLAPATVPVVSRSSRRMAREVKDLEVHYDQTTQLPNLIICMTPQATLTGSRRRGRAAARMRTSRTPEGAAVDFVRTRGDLWQLTAEDAGTVDVVSISQPKGSALIL